MGSRRKGRILAFQGVFSWDANPGQDDLFSFTWLDEERKKSYNTETLCFAGLLLKGTIENIGIIDTEIRNHLQHWDFDRLSRVDLAVLRVGVYSLLYQPEIPRSVTINEAVDIAKLYGSDESYRFINGVLDSIRNDTGETAQN